MCSVVKSALDGWLVFLSIDQLLIEDFSVDVGVPFTIRVDRLAYVPALAVILNFCEDNLIVAKAEATVVPGCNDPVLLLDVFLQPLHLVRFDFQQLHALFLDSL